MAYSPFFQTLHDETTPIGTLGRGAHYSVLRAVTWRDAFLRDIHPAAFHDFAVVWDEDHDTRIVDVIEELYFEGLLAPVRFIGEQKAFLTVLLAPEFCEESNGKTFDTYCERLMNSRQRRVGNDLWNVQVDSTTSGLSIIGDDPLTVRAYLDCIDILWRLGIKPARTGDRAGEGIPGQGERDSGMIPNGVPG